MKTLFPILSLSLLFVACGRGGGSIDASKFLAERDSILLQNENQKKELDGLNALMSTISRSLDSIAYQENIVYSLGGDRTPTKKQVLENLRNFELLIERQRMMIATLQDSLRSRNGNSSKVTNIISFLNRQLAEKDITIQNLRKELSQKNKNIADLKEHITALNANVAALTERTEMQEEALTVQDAVINEGYIKVGTKKELQKAGLLIKGRLFSKYRLNVSGMTPSQFTKVDIRHFNDLMLPSGNLKILTDMPDTSYSLEETGTEVIMHIVSPSEFWSISNYLVIQTD